MNEGDILFGFDGVRTYLFDVWLTDVRTGFSRLWKANEVRICELIRESKCVVSEAIVVGIRSF